MKGDQDNPWLPQGYHARRLGPSLWNGPEVFDPSYPAHQTERTS
jgi:hypothetical protein